MARRRPNGHARQAAKCFGKAGDTDLQTEAEALYLCYQRKHELQGEALQRCLLEAGEKFLSLGQGVRAAQCFAFYERRPARCCAVPRRASPRRAPLSPLLCRAAPRRAAPRRAAPRPV